MTGLHIYGVVCAGTVRALGVAHELRMVGRHEPAAVARRTARINRL